MHCRINSALNIPAPLQDINMLVINNFTQTYCWIYVWFCVYNVAAVCLFSKAFLSLQLKFRFFHSHVTLFLFQTL